MNQELFARANFPNVSEFYGGQVILQGDTLVVAASNDGSSAVGINGNEADNSAPQAGAVWVYVRQDGQWVQQAYIKASNTNGGDVFGNPGDQFGNSIAMSGNTLVVGAPEERSSARGVNGNQNDNSIINAGAAYVFVRNNGIWNQQAY
ncbi:MAG: FG-GAP repeat protein, partial [Gammaproteobacteria bacterium]|nr:FG-GAP repeat protein [Gammaproteobacteria bacterium]